jgi:hypothetical protein
MTKISGLPEDTSPTSDDWTVSVDNTTGSTKKVKWLNLGALFSSAILPLVYPVGSIYTETTGTNPATTFGFGTWASYAQGAALVGVAASGTFANPGTVVGAETHVQTWSEMPQHYHGVNDPGHSHGIDWSGDSPVRTSAGGTNNRVAIGGSGQQLQFGGGAIQGSGTGISTQNAGASSAMSLVQPSIPVFIWRRTA